MKGSSIPLELYVIDDQRPVDEDNLFEPDLDETIPYVKHRETHERGMRWFRSGEWGKAMDAFSVFYADTQVRGGNGKWKKKKN